MPTSVIPLPPVVATRPRRVLAIDDDDGLLDMLNLLLCQTDFDLRTARGGKTGLELAITWEPDVILLDLGMPDLDGATFLEQYRKATTSPAPVVLLTGALDGVSRATELGVSMFLSKPFDLGTLVDVVDVYASRSGKDVALG
jgi:two-component system, OmpR family, KDP operon response regulator KdpE